MQQNVCGEVQLDSAVHRDVCGAESTGTFVESDCGKNGLYSESAAGRLFDRNRASFDFFQVSAVASAEVENHAIRGSRRGETALVRCFLWHGFMLRYAGNR